MRIFVATLFVSGSLSAPALADDNQSALVQFGLIGTWSPDCSKEVSQPRGSRVSFASLAEGGATATTLDNNGEVLITTVYEIVESAIVGGDRIEIALHPVTVTKSDGKAASQHEYDNLRVVFHKAGERIEVIRVQFEGLPEVQLTNAFEKCQN